MDSSSRKLLHDLTNKLQAVSGYIELRQHDSAFRELQTALHVLELLRALDKVARAVEGRQAERNGAA